MGPFWYACSCECTLWGDDRLPLSLAKNTSCMSPQDPSAAQRLGDMLQLLASAVVPGQGFIPPCLSDIKNQSTYQASGAATVLNYGHNIEASWLLQYIMKETGRWRLGLRACNRKYAGSFSLLRLTTEGLASASGLCQRSFACGCRL